MRPSTVVTVATVAVAFACSRAPGAGAPVPSAVPASVAPAAGDTGTRRVAFTTAVVTQGGPVAGMPAGPRARIVGSSIPPLELIRDSTFNVIVLVGADGKAKLETLRMHDGATEVQRAATRAWLERSTFTMPTTDGVPREAPFEIRGRMGARNAQAMRALGAATMGAPAASDSAARRARPRRMLNPGELGPEQLIALAPRAARIVSDLDTLFLRPGMQVSFAWTLRIGVLDSAGGFLGYMTAFDSRVHGPVFELDGRSITAKTEGASELQLGWPRSMWRGRADEPPVVVVPVVSAARVSEERLLLQGGATGSGGEQCSPLPGEIECDVHVTWHEDLRNGGSRQARLRRITLSRTSPRTRLGIDMGDTAAFNAYERAMRATQREIEDRGHRLSGTFDNAGRLIGLEHSRNGDTLFVAGQPFTTTWRRDSATVLLIDYRKDPLAPTVRTFTIGSQVPEGLVRQQWTRGDTTFIVHPRDAGQRWHAFFDRFPAIAEFLK